MATIEWTQDEVSKSSDSLSCHSYLTSLWNISYLSCQKRSKQTRGGEGIKFLDFGWTYLFERALGVNFFASWDHRIIKKSLRLVSYLKYSMYQRFSFLLFIYRWCKCNWLIIRTSRIPTRTLPYPLKFEF